MLLRVHVYLSSSLEIPQGIPHLPCNLDLRVDMNCTVGLVLFVQNREFFVVKNPFVPAKKNKIPCFFERSHLEFLDILKLPRRRIIVLKLLRAAYYLYLALLKVEFWRATATYSPQTSSATVAVAAPAVAICFNSLLTTAHGGLPICLDFLCLTEGEKSV